MAGKPKPLSLALQGGGAHGAYTWGVLDALLEDGRINPRAITATSAGAITPQPSLIAGWTMARTARAKVLNASGKPSLRTVRPSARYCPAQPLPASCRFWTRSRA